MPGLTRIDRRTFLADLGRGAVAVAILGVTGCSPTAIASLVPGPSASGSGGPTPVPPGGATAGATPAATNPPASARSPGSPPPGGVAWERVNLGFVSAYLLVRGGEAALVDTGVAGSTPDITASLAGLGLGWDAVGHVILTHHHSDHQGSIRTILDEAPDAAVYAGAEDVASMLVGGVTAVGDGERVFDLQIVTTPGHTAGSISVFDSIAGIVVVGDAMGTSDGRPTLPNAAFTEDMSQAKASIAKLGTLAFETLLVGHGNPIEGGAAALVAEARRGALSPRGPADPR